MHLSDGLILGFCPETLSQTKWYSAVKCDKALGIQWCFWLETLVRISWDLPLMNLLRGMDLNVGNNLVTMWKENGCQDMFTVFCCIYVKWISFLLSFVFLFFFLFFTSVVVFIVQSSGIETLVEELCSKLKDLQSKQGKK